MNKLKTIKAINSQKGMTVLGLLMGVSLSMVSMLACTSLFINHHGSSLEAKKSSAYTSQITHMMIIFHRYISTAGFGLTDTGNAHIEVDTTTNGTTSVYWRYADSGSIICKGLTEKQLTLNGKQHRSLLSTEAIIGCSDTVEFSTMTWTDVAILAQWRKDATMETYLSSNSDRFFDFTLNSAAATVACTPYNLIDPTNPNPHPSLSISAPTLAQLNGNTTVAATSIDVCLPNL